MGEETRVRLVRQGHITGGGEDTHGSGTRTEFYPSISVDRPCRPRYAPATNGEQIFND